MNYRQIPPPELLKNHIRYFWILESEGTATDRTSFRAIADGCPGIIFYQSDDGSFFREDKQLPDIFLYGQATSHSDIHSPCRFRAIGVYLYPNALQAVFGLNAVELTDSCIDLNETCSGRMFSLKEQLINVITPEEQIRILSAYLLSQIGNTDLYADTIAQYALTRIINSRGNISMTELQQSVSLSERSFERRFKQSIGLSPKLFSRICRFQASLNQLRNNDYQKLSDLAFQHDYADQSHHIRAFKEFAGCSPYQFQKQLNELVENFPKMKK
jgi:AraC-like DNA-binding protein